MSKKTAHAVRINEKVTQLPTAAATRLYVCAECRYAQLFAVQPRALCTANDGACAGQVVFAGQPACSAMSPRKGVDFSLALCARAATPFNGGR